MKCKESYKCRFWYRLCGNILILLALGVTIWELHQVVHFSWCFLCGYSEITEYQLKFFAANYCNKWIYYILTTTDVGLEGRSNVCMKMKTQTGYSTPTLPMQNNYYQ